jgi:two-component system, OmpR family, phosphate regulon sensor histidine kinase PhoR
MRFRAWRGLSDEYRQQTEGHSPWTLDTPDPEPVLVADVADEPSLDALRPVIENEGIRALGFFPLLDRGKLLGKFMVYFETPHVFTSTEVRLAQAIGSQIALEIARSRRESETRFLLEASQILGRSLDFRATLQGLAELCVPFVADFCAVDLVSGNGPRRVASAGAADGASVRPEIVKAVASSGLPDVLDDRATSLMVVPLTAAGRTLGAMSFVATSGLRRYGREDLEFAADVARRAALATENGLLHQADQRRSDAASVLAHVGDGVFHLGPDERVLLWNRGATVITGIDETEALHRPIPDLIVDWARIRPRITITDVPLAFGRRVALPAQIRGRELWLAISGVASGDGIVYAFRDVTESERLEKSRRDFLATASHELRTPLSGVFGAAKTLLHRELDEQTRHALLEIIDSQAGRLAQILDELLAASRIDAGITDIVVGECDLAPLVDEVVMLQRSRLPEDITLAVAPVGALPRVHCDPERVKQVVLNLLDNAIKYSPGGGAVTVSFAEGEREVRVSVADEGLGVPPGERERIFEKFYRLDPELTRGVGGTGLGLYISRQYVDQMNGRLWVEPAPGGGSVFNLELPIA